MRVVVEPAGTLDGLAAPAPDGFVEVPAAGAKATPRKTLFVPAVATVVSVPLFVALYPLESVSDTNVACPAANSVTAPFDTDPVRLRSCRLVEPIDPATVPFDTHRLVLDSENFRMPPPLATALSSAMYSVSTPAIAGFRSAKKNEYGLEGFDTAGMPGNWAIVCPPEVGSPVPTVPSRNPLAPEET